MNLIAPSWLEEYEELRNKTEGNTMETGSVVCFGLRGLSLHSR